MSRVMEETAQTTHVSVVPRETFNGAPATAIAGALDMTRRSASGRSSRFAYFEDDDRFLVVAGRSEVPDVDLALAYGLTWAGGKRLVLALPEGCTVATEQRLAWLSDERRPELFAHSRDGQVRRVPPLSRSETLAVVREQSAHAGGERPLLPAHFLVAAPALDQLAGMAADRGLQPAHRPGVRSWHCQGLRVLSAEATRTLLTVRAGVHSGSAGHRSHTITGPVGSLLTGEQVRRLSTEVEAAVDHRLRGPQGSLHRPDEHWLQAVIRSRPALAGLTGVVHREVASWRPRDGALWSRGFIDLVGAGDDGSIRVVETKLSSKEDTRFVLQALDYFLWATAHRADLAAALQLADDAVVDLRLLIGAGTGDRLALSRYSREVAMALAADVPWTFAAVTDWFDGEPQAHTAPHRTMPAGWSNSGRATGNAYVDAARAVAERWKATSATVEPECARMPGSYRSSPGSAVYDFCLPVEHAQLNLLPDVRAEALAHFRDQRIAWHASVGGGPTSHLLSSQVQCVNALGRMVRDPDRLRAVFGQVLDITTVDPIAVETYLTFEWTPDRDLLGEGRNGKLRRGTGNTSVDAAFRFTTSTGRPALALVEWKFTESYTRPRRADAAADETRRARYERLVQDPAGPIDGRVLPFHDLLDEPFYQLTRQQLLAHALEDDPDEPATEVHVVHVVPPANRAYQESLVRETHRRAGETVDAVWAEVSRRPDRYHRMDPVVFLDRAVTSDEYVARYSVPDALPLDDTADGT